jgi:hypothetical protein
MQRRNNQKARQAQSTGPESGQSPRDKRPDTPQKQAEERSQQERQKACDRLGKTRFPEQCG